MQKKLCVGVTALLFVVAMGGVATAAVYTPTIDHYTCYKVKDTTDPKMENVPGVLIDNELESATIEVKRKMKWACVPTSKNGEPIPDTSGEWLCAYKVKSDKLATPVLQDLTNQFQFPASLEIKKSNLLLVPCDPVP
jgi:hypothetical protein